MNDETFAALTPAQKRAVCAELYAGAARALREGMEASDRRGKSSGSAFLWVSLYGKSKVERAFRTFVKSNARMIKNYRGTPNAWYFGSQNDVSYWDGLNAMCKYLTSQGINSYTCDAWD